MNNVSLSQFGSVVLSFLRERNKSPELTVDPEQNLFDSGLMDSFDLPRLILHVESELNARLLVGEDGIEGFYTIEKAFALFVSSN